MITALVSLLTLTAGSGPASPASDTATFVTTLGRDTVALERYEQTPLGLHGDNLLRAPRTVRYHYVIRFRPEGGLAHSVVDLTMPGMRNGPHVRTTVTVTGDTARIDVDSSGVVKTSKHAVTPRIMPALMTGFDSDYGLYISFGMYQAIAATLGPAVNVVADVPVIDVAGGQLRTRQLVRRSATDVDVEYVRGAWAHLTVDSRGRVERADASETTEKTHSVRTGPVSIDSAAQAFERRDRAGHAVGVLSPSEVTTGRIGSTSLMIRYSSPRKRGRVILGPTVPFGQVWRTGADAATELIVNRPVTIGAKRIQAGTYTLWTIPEPERATLIINGQYGQWGTNYDSTQDVARVPMQVKRGQPVEEEFTISLSTSASSGELRMAWDDFVWTVAVSAP